MADERDGTHSRGSASASHHKLKRNYNLGAGNKALIVTLGAYITLSQVWHNSKLEVSVMGLKLLASLDMIIRKCSCQRVGRRSKLIKF